MPECRLCSRIERANSDLWSVVWENRGLVHAIARRLHQQAPWIDYDELVSDGLVLLHQAVERHNQDVARLSTYGSKIVWWGLLKAIKRRRKSLAQCTGDDAIADAEDDCPDPEESMVARAQAVELSVRVAAVAGSLDDLSWAVVSRRSGYYDGQQWTFARIGADVGCSKDRARLAYRDAVRSLRGE